MQSTHNTLSENIRAQSIEFLNKHLAAAIAPYPLGIADEQEHVFAISGTLAAFGQSAREAVDQAATFGDTDTADLFTEISRGIDHQLWFVESHIAKKRARQCILEFCPGRAITA